MNHAFLRTAEQKDVDRAVGEVIGQKEGWYGRYFRDHFTQDETYGPYRSRQTALEVVERVAGKRLEFRQTTWGE